MDAAPSEHVRSTSHANLAIKSIHFALKKKKKWIGGLGGPLKLPTASDVNTVFKTAERAKLHVKYQLFWLYCSNVM